MVSAFVREALARWMLLTGVRNCFSHAGALRCPPPAFYDDFGVLKLVALAEAFETN